MGECTAVVPLLYGHIFCIKGDNKVAEILVTCLSEHWPHPLYLRLASSIVFETGLILCVWDWSHPLCLRLASSFVFETGLILCVWDWSHPLCLRLVSSFVFETGLILCVWDSPIFTKITKNSLVGLMTFRLGL
jgi:hypothetical protein